MDCKNHPGTAAVDRCAGCFESFCKNCLVPIRGQSYCASCKTLVLAGKQPSVPDAGSMPCPEAGEALKYAIIGLFCFGIILGPVAIQKALKARSMIAANPRLTGSGKATAALIIGILDVVFWVLGIIARVSNMNR